MHAAASPFRLRIPTLKTKDKTTTKRSTAATSARKAPAKASSKVPAKSAAASSRSSKPSAASSRGKGAAPRKAAAKSGAVRKAAAKGAAKRNTTAKSAPAKKSRAAAPAPPVLDPGMGKLAPIVAKLRQSVISALEEMKAKEIKEIDIRGRASFADLLVIASGTSTRHVKSLADEVVKFVKKAGMMPLGIEGQKEAEWVLVDLGDIVCHLMLPRIREFYALERLWSVGGDAEASND